MNNLIAAAGIATFALMAAIAVCVALPLWITATSGMF